MNLIDPPDNMEYLITGLLHLISQTSPRAKWCEMKPQALFPVSSVSNFQSLKAFEVFCTKLQSCRYVDVDYTIFSGKYFKPEIRKP